ncbi:MAG: HDIG domain-containing protein [Capsulimonadales bacterium]|nr:HDIG domain-containing protein [Capsulimonadales bacterium]
MSDRPTKTREDAWNLMTEWTASDSLRKHMRAVEIAMRSAARRLGEDEALWGMTGLLHDFDYERYPTVPDHPLRGSEVLTAEGYPAEVIRAILGHAPETGVPRDTLMARYLFAVDELSGFITAVAYVRPSKKLADVDVSSVKKKLKDKAFARAVSREDITNGAAEIGLDLDTHIGNVLADLKADAVELGI